jgi:cellulose synthase/poly-beta-1,6-N-acetylglucosamine synthase-like glycosyltransferase
MYLSIIFFWVSFSVLFFCYIGYGILLVLLNTANKIVIPSVNQTELNELLPVTILVAAYNEDQVLEQKIKNTLAIDYPVDKLNIIFITDGSLDDSVNIINRYPAVTLLHNQQRKGKFAAIQRAMQFVHTPLVIFSDANTLLNKECIRRLVRHYKNERVGGVAGEKKIIRNGVSSAIGEAEGLYWQYESFLKKLDADFHTVVGAAGELFSIRTKFFKAVNDELILDDFIISMNVCLQGYTIAYEAGAFATELPSVTLADEEKRKIRIAAGAYQSIGYVKSSLNFIKYPLLCFQFLSRRLLRWVCCPPLLMTLFVSNIFIVSNGSMPLFYSWFLYTQLLFYVSAFVGWLLVHSGKKAGLLTIPFYFVFMNYCLVKGFFRFIKGRQTVLWEKSLRQAIE